MDIINRCSVDYSYRLSVANPMVTKTILSNTVTTQIIRERLEIKKFVNKESASPFDILIYTIIILNITGELIENLFFKDVIPNSARFIENSVAINNIKKSCLNPEKGFYIGNLNRGDEIKITFKGLILPSHLNKYIKNKSSIEYNYIYNVEKQPIRICKESNSAITRYDKNLFKQIMIGNSIKTHTNIDYIIAIKCKAEIINTKIINSYTLNCCNVLALGKLKYKILYKSYGNSMYLEKVFGFSEFISAPIGILYLSEINIRINIEDICSQLINRNTIFLNCSLLMYF